MEGKQQVFCQSGVVWLSKGAKHDYHLIYSFKWLGVQSSLMFGKLSEKNTHQNNPPNGQATSDPVVNRTSESKWSAPSALKWRTSGVQRTNNPYSWFRSLDNYPFKHALPKSLISPHVPLHWLFPPKGGIEHVRSKSRNKTLSPLNAWFRRGEQDVGFLKYYLTAVFRAEICLHLVLSSKHNHVNVGPGCDGDKNNVEKTRWSMPYDTIAFFVRDELFLENCLSMPQNDSIYRIC